MVMTLEIQVLNIIRQAITTSIDMARLVALLTTSMNLSIPIPVLHAVDFKLLAFRTRIVSQSPSVPYDGNNMVVHAWREAER
jgi:hypothetical protein